MEIADRTNVLLFLIISYTCDTLLKLFLETFSNIGEECERQSEPPAEPADENNLAYIILLGDPGAPRSVVSNTSGYFLISSLSF